MEGVGRREGRVRVALGEVWEGHVMQQMMHVGCIREVMAVVEPSVTD